MLKHGFLGLQEIFFLTQCHDFYGLDKKVSLTHDLLEMEEKL